VAGVDTVWAIAMNKRTFIRVFGVRCWQARLSHLCWPGRQKTDCRTGRAIWKYSTERLYSANSLEQVRSYVKKQSKLKVPGKRVIALNNIADSTHNFLSLKSMDEVVALEPEAHTRARSMRA